MTMKFFSAGIAMAALLALGACKSESTGGGGAGGSIGSGGSDPGSGGSVIGSGGSGGTVDSCFDCACASDSPCVAVCDDMGVDSNGNPKLNFCTAGMTNGSMCGQCVQENCGAALADCN
jgi:hypothetical protein